MNTIEVEVKDLIPNWVETPTTLGKGKIAYIIGQWKWHLAYPSSRVKNLREMLAILLNIVEIAKSYSNTLVSAQEAHLERNSNITTLNICGWCRFAYDRYAPGPDYSGRRNFKLRCEFKRDAGLYSDSSGTRGEEWDRYDTLCFLKESSKEIVKVLEKGIKNRLANFVDEEQKIKEKIKILSSFLE